MGCLALVGQSLPIPEHNANIVAVAVSPLIQGFSYGVTNYLQGFADVW